MAFRLIFARFAALACCIVALTPGTAFAVAWTRVGTIDNSTATNTALCTWSTTGSGMLECSSANPYIAGGFLGIGSTSPVNALDIGTSQGIRIASGTPTNTAYALYNNAGTLTWNGSALDILSGGVANYDAIWTSPTTIGTGLIYETGGKVGIGTTGPGSTLDIWGTAAGDLGLNSSAYETQLNMVNTSTSGQSWRIATGGSSGGFAGGNFGIYDKTNAVVRMSVSPAGNIYWNGNVGVATTSPQSKLHVYGGEVQVGSSGTGCANNNGGAVRFNGSTLYYCDGTSTGRRCFRERAASQASARERRG